MSSTLDPHSPPTTAASTDPLGHQVVAELRRRVIGSILYPGDPEFVAAAIGHNLAALHLPQAIVRAANADDVEGTVAVAAAHGVPLTVMATGHSVGPVTGGILLLTSELQDVVINPTEKTATIGAGVRWAEVVTAAAEFGLAPLCGSSLDVGVVGFLLGGGIGPLSRRYGFAADHVVQFKVVTGDGMLRTVDADQNADLFWALRGGKCGLGIVTGVTIRLFSVDIVYGGQIFYPAEAIDTVLQAYVDWSGSLPETVSSSVSIVRLPALPEIPPPLQGKCVALLRVLMLEVESVGQEILAPMRSVAVPLMEALQAGSFADWMQMHGEQTPPMPIWQRGRLLGAFTSGAARTLLAFCGPDQQPPLMAVEIRHLAGQLNNHVVDGGAIGGREGVYLINMIGVPVPELFDVVIPGFADALLQALGPVSDGTTNINFHGDVSATNPMSLAWPAPINAELGRIRRRYDPKSVLAPAEPSTAA